MPATRSGVGTLTLAQAKAVGSWDDPVNSFGHRGARERPKETECFDFVEVGAALHTGLISLHLNKAFEPADWESDFSFDDLLRADEESEFIGADSEADAFVVADLGESGAHIRIEVDIGGSLTGHDTIICVWIQINAGVGAATGGKAFEPD